MRNINLHIYPSNFTHESRILKETETIASSGLVDQIFIIAIWKEGLEEHENLSDKREIWRVALKTATFPDSAFWKIIKHIEWMLRILLRFRNESVRIVNCHNLSSLPIGILFKIFLRSKVVYDTHELETGRHGWSWMISMIGKLLERSLIYRVDIVIVVSESIAQWYKAKYSLTNVYSIYNYPRKQVGDEIYDSRILRERFNIQDDEILYIYQGIFGGGRGIEIMLNIFSKIERGKHIVFMGYGTLENKVRELESKYPNIHFHPAVRPDDVLFYTASADVGLSFTENTCLNHYLTLGNKVLEYIVAGLPVITTDLPEASKIIDRYRCGWKVTADEISIIHLLDNITKEDIKEKRDNVLKCKDNFTWEKEGEKLLGIYHSIFQA